MAALSFGEYRTSVDIDFLISDMSGYRALRENVKRGGLHSLFKDLTGINVEAAFSADQYGIRGTVLAIETAVKFEIVVEGRIELGAPGQEILGVAPLNQEDLICEKLMANSDRYIDSATFNRDLIDLAFMEPKSIRKSEGWRKAEAAYGKSIERDFSLAAQHLLEDPAWLNRCLSELEIAAPRALVYKLVEQLVR